MTFSQPWSTRHTTWVAGGVSLALMAPLVSVKPAIAASFSDVSFSYWARPFIESLAKYNIINGYSDGSFRPDDPISKAQFETLLQRSFGPIPGQSSYMITSDQPISRMQGLVTLSNRLGLETEGGTDSTLSAFRDAVDIPSYAREEIAAATENNLVVNYPNVQYLNPDQAMTRADAAAFVYQALVQQGQLSPVSETTRTASYVVTQPSLLEGSAKPTDYSLASQRIAQGTEIPLKYPGSRNVNLVIVPGETYETTLAVADPVLDQNGNVAIPRGSKVEGQFVPMRVNGNMSATQFVAERIMVGDRSYRLNAISGTRMAVNESEVDPGTLEDSVASAAAKTVVDSIMGKPSGLGGFLSKTFGLDKPDGNDQSVIMIKPDSLTLTTQSAFRVSS